MSTVLHFIIPVTWNNKIRLETKKTTIKVWLNSVTVHHWSWCLINTCLNVYKKGFLSEAIKSYSKNRIKLMIFIKCIVLNWVILCSEIVNVSLFFHTTLGDVTILSLLYPPRGVDIVISGERERNTKDKTQEKWRSSRKERILFICHLFPSPHCFLMLFIFSPFSYKSQTLQQALTSSLIANYLGQKMSVSPFGSFR